MAKPTFGIFDHIEDIPGTPTQPLFRDRLELIRLADEAGFESFHLAEHHGSELCLAPNQEVFIAAASQVTTRIRLGPMVKLLPFHHPVRILEDMCVADQLTGGRLDFGVGSGAAPIEHAWFGSDWRDRKERFEDTLRIICRALATGAISSEGSAYHDFPTAPLATTPVQDPIPFWYPGNPATAGRYGMSLMWPGPIDRHAYDAYVEAWNEHKDDPVRFDGPDSRPRVGCTMIVAIAPTEREALDIGRRAMDGLVRRDRGGARERPSDHVPRGLREGDRAAARDSRARRAGRCGGLGHGRADRRALRGDARAGADRAREPSDPNRGHDLRGGQAHLRALRVRGEAPARAAPLSAGLRRERTPAFRRRGHHLPPRLLLGGRRHRLPAAGDRSARPDLRPVGGARDRDEAVPDRVHPRRRRSGHRLPRHARRPPRLGDVPRPGRICRLRRRPPRPRPRAVPPGRARACRQPVPVRAGLRAFHELRERADGAPDRTPPHPVAGKRRPGRPERPPVRRRGRLAARGLRRPRTPWSASAARPCSTRSARRS